MTAALPIMKPNGTLIIAASCDEGIGSPDFTRLMLETPSIEAFRERLVDPNFFIPDQWQLQMMCRALDQANVLYFTDHIDSATLRKLFVIPISSVEAGIEMALATHGSGSRIAVIPDGPYVMPRVTPPVI
jgi:nickel-dependent lactate racemase